MAEQMGLIGAYLLNGEGGRALSGWDEVRGWQPGQGVLWVHLDREQRGTEEWLEQESGLDFWVTEALLAEETRPRVVLSNDSLLVFLRGVNLNPGAEPEDMVSVRLWSDGKRIISTRVRRVFAVHDLREALARGEGPADAGSFLGRLTEGLALNMEGVIEELKEKMDDLEEGLLDEDAPTTHRPISEFRQHAVILRRYLAPQRDAMNHLQGGQVSWLSAEDRHHLREVTDVMTRYLEEIESVRDRASILREELSGRLTERMERRMYSLSLIGTLFLPLTFVTGLLGINVGGIPGAEYPLAFALVALALLAAGVAQVLFMRWRGWF